MLSFLPLCVLRCCGQSVVNSSIKLIFGLPHFTKMGTLLFLHSVMAEDRNFFFSPKATAFPEPVRLSFRFCFEFYILVSVHYNSGMISKFLVTINHLKMGLTSPHPPSQPRPHWRRSRKTIRRGGPVQSQKEGVWWKAKWSTCGGLFVEPSSLPRKGNSKEDIVILWGRKHFTPKPGRKLRGSILQLFPSLISSLIFALHSFLPVHG